MDDITMNAISSLGFPAVLCFYLLVKMNRTLEELTKAINSLNNEVKEREEKTLAKVEELQKAYNEIKIRIEHIN